MTWGLSSSITVFVDILPLDSEIGTSDSVVEEGFVYVISLTISLYISRHVL